MIITLAIALGAVKSLATTPSAEDTSSATEIKTEAQDLSQGHSQDLQGPSTTTSTDKPIKEKKLKPTKEKLTPVSLPDQPPVDSGDCNIPYISTADCSACPAPCAEQEHEQYPSYLTIDFEKPLLHSMKPYTRHVLISTGKEDWPAHIDDDKESLAPFLQKAIDDGQQRLKEANGGQELPPIVLTNSSRLSETWGGPGWQVIILPDHIVVDNVTPEQCDDFFEAFLKPAVGNVLHENTTHDGARNMDEWTVEKDGSDHHNHFQGTSVTNPWSPEAATTTPKKLAKSVSSSSLSSTSSSPSTSSSLSSYAHGDQSKTITAGKTTFLARKWERRGAIMICSHKKRDKRCGVTAPYLKKAFKETLLSKDMYGDGEDDVEIWCVSHIGGHKFAGNVIVHRREGMAVWYGRVSPCHAQHIVDVTVENGQVIRELYRGSMIGSFDPSRKKMAW